MLFPQIQQAPGPNFRKDGNSPAAIPLTNILYFSLSNR